MKKILLSAITDPDGSFSWRKFMTFVATSLFAYAVIGFEVRSNFAELPSSYVMVIGGVFGFYFLKNTLSNTKVTTSPTPSSNENATPSNTADNATQS